MVNLGEKYLFPDQINPEVTGKVREQLAELYGERLRQIVLYGSRARGDHRPESDYDFLVVLDEVDDRFDEIRNINYALSSLNEQLGFVLQFWPVSESEYREKKGGLCRKARDEGVTI